MKPYIILVKDKPDPKDGGYGVGRPSFGAWIVLAEDEQDACDLVDEVIRDGCTIEGSLGVAPVSVASGYELKPNVPTPFPGIHP